VAFLRSRRGLRLLALAVVVAAVCVRLGFWQLDRYHQRGEQNAAVRTALAAEPAPLEVVVPPGTAPTDVPAAEQWRLVTLTGQYDPDGQVVLRLRPLQGSPGVHVLTPLVPPSGPAVLVDRGFLPSTGPGGSARTELDLPQPPSGTVTVEGRLRLSEPGRGTGLDAEVVPPSLRFVDLDALPDELGTPLAPVWVEAVSQQPPAGDELVAVPELQLSSGPSLIYAVQWFLFAAIALVGGVVLARREGEDVPRAGEAAVDDGPDRPDRPDSESDDVQPAARGGGPETP
jgi:cytochrome oxidase assembly protein ShyY1